MKCCGNKTRLFPTQPRLWCYPVSGKMRCCQGCRSSSPCHGCRGVSKVRVWGLVQGMEWMLAYFLIAINLRRRLSLRKLSVNKWRGAYPNAVQRWQKFFRGKPSWLRTRLDWFLQKKNVLYSLPQSQGVYLPANNFDHKSHPLRIATGSWIHKDVFLIQPICWQSSTSGTIIHHNGDPKFSAKIMYIKNHIPVILVN